MPDSGTVPLSLPENPRPDERPAQPSSCPPGSGVRRPDSRPSKLPDAQKIVASGAVEKDQALEQKLVGIVSNLEYCRAQLSEHENRPQAAEVLPILTAMVNQVAGGVERRVGPQADRQTLDKALAKASAFHDAIRTFSDQFGSPSLFKAIFKLFRKSTATEEERQQRFRQVTGSLVEVLDSFFQVYQSAFQSPQTAEAWAQTYAIFLNDLIQVLDRLHY
jgi:hypothetical protein